MTVKITLNKIMLKESEVSMRNSFFLLRKRLAKAIPYSFAPRFERLFILRFALTPANRTASTGAIRAAILPGLLAAIQTVR
ncbi:hypothetical protein D3C86_2118960 [compost metagenome]